MLKFHLKNISINLKLFKFESRQLISLITPNKSFSKYSKFYFTEDNKNNTKKKTPNQKTQKASPSEKPEKENSSDSLQKAENNETENYEKKFNKLQKDESVSDSDEEDDDQEIYDDFVKDVNNIEYDEKIKEILKPKKPLKNEKYTIDHRYEKSDKKIPTKKVSLENLVSQMLRNEEITSQRAEEIKKEIRDPLNNSFARHLTKINSRGDFLKYVKSYSDLYFYQTTFEKMDRVTRYVREFRDMNDPAFIQLRSQSRLLKNEDMVDKKMSVLTDTRQNFNNPDWLKMQPRLYDVAYNYNNEHHKEFNKKFPKYVEEDKKKVLEKKKLLKYIKLNPDLQQVRERFIPKMLPPGLTPDNIPDFDVDITNYKPPITRRSRRKFNVPRHNTNFKNYECWRTFDRFFLSFSSDRENIKVNLVPSKLVARFGPPGCSQHPDFTGMYYFEDENLDLFLLGDFLQTQDAWGFNYPDEFYEKQNSVVRAEKRLKKWPSCDEFWSSTEEKEFRIYYLRYSELLRFKRWIRIYVNYFDYKKDKTLNEILDEKYGKIDDYSDFYKKREVDELSLIHNFSHYKYLDENELSKISRTKISFPTAVTAENGEKYDHVADSEEQRKKIIRRDLGEIYVK